MTQKEVNELFAPRILGARWLEENGNKEEQFSARMTRYSLETLREELLRKVRNEQSHPSDTAKRALRRRIESKREGQACAA